ncbi:RDD family protein [Actinophytocola glycyrrhizae]
MTVPRPSRQIPVQEHAGAQVEQVLGPQIAKRLGAFRNGVLYVEAGGWARFLAWLVDVIVSVLGMAVGFIVAAGVGQAADLGNGTVTLIAIAILFLSPLLYGGLCYRNGRALGAVLTGTRLVRTKDGGRIGGWASWAMLVRVLFPLLVIGAIIGALGGGGPVSGGSDRVSVDPRAIRQLHAAGIT